ncbi:unnamed protein product [Staurois parvus]|uniref:TNFR-Cys domain-containing protein n=1 Tax=Staurois parvus TaxID=386267 RepID=A0ABN9DP96_9NEOB|nr:unnamed protein product [Staurois parvus]
MRRTMEETSKMRALCFLVSFLWVFPSADQAFDIPLPNALLIHGEPMGFNTSSHRQKRSEKENVTACSSHEYKPRRQNHCCNKCLPGYIVARDCSGSSQATLCVHCKSGTYMDIPNNSKRCEACSSCLTQYGQIVLSACTMEKNTQCGCPEGQFKKHSGLDFICQECTTCQNGTQAFKCHDDKDTICQCFHNFFFDDSEKMCRPCSQCQGPECQDHCPDPEAAQRPEESKGVLWVAVGAVAVVVVVVVACALYVYYTRRHPHPQAHLLIYVEQLLSLITIKTAIKTTK